MSISDYPYLRQKLAEEEAARRQSRHDSGATIRASPDEHASSTPTLHELPVPTKENDWLGFCHSAMKLQNGDRKSALKKRTDYQSAFAASGVTTFYCSAKGCAYQGHISVDFVWKSVMADEKLGLKCRWAFLAKSHIKQNVVTGRQYSFQCPICIYQYGHAEGRTWKGVDIFIDHISSHRGKDLYAEVLEKLKIVNDRVVEDKEDFELNLFPTSMSKGADNSRSSVTLTQPPLSRTQTRSNVVESIWSRKASSALDIGSGLQRSQTSQTNRSDRADSVVGGAPIEEETEPWSEGLSDFKMDKEEDYLSPDF